MSDIFCKYYQNKSNNLSGQASYNHAVIPDLTFSLPTYLTTTTTSTTGTTTTG